MQESEKQALKPKLRFPEFRKGKGWEEKALKEICEINPPSPGLPDSFIYIDLESVEAGVLRSRNRIDKQNAPSRAQRLLKNGDVAFQIVRPYQQNNLFVQFNDNEAYVSSTGYAQLRAKESESFLYQLIHTNPFIKRVIAKCTGSSYPAINSSDLGDIRVATPPSRQEQDKIAECLTSLDNAITAQGRKVEALKAHKKGLMQQLFPYEGETVPRLRLPEFRTKWKLKKIGALLQETTRPIDLEDEINYSLVTVKRRYGGVVSREVLRGKAIKVKSQFIVKANDFLISKRQIVHNACGLVPPNLEGSIVSNEYSVLTPKEGCDIEFFNYFSQQPCVSESFFQSSVGIVIEKMLFKLNLWLNLEFPFPPFDEQQRIATCMKSSEIQIIAESQKLDALKAYKNGLMQQLFPLPEADT